MVLDYPQFNAALTQATSSFQDSQGKTKDRVVINVGGKRHETYISTIRNFPDTRLYWIAETAAKMVDFDPERNEFFFDRHPGCFENILNYCRTGKLHCPNDVCGPLFEEELAFWGIDELQMEPCCWGTYTQHRNAHKHLRMFDNIRTEGPEGEEDDGEQENKVGFRQKSRLGEFLSRWRPVIWSTLERPYSSKYAQGVALVNLLVIVLSIASFCIETMAFVNTHRRVFTILEYFYCAFFTTDFIIRICCCPHIGKFFQSPMTWIDLASIVQFYINFFANSDVLDFLFVLRLVRIFRLFRFFKNLSGMQVIGQTLKASARELFLLILILLIPMVIFSTLVYFAEKQQKLPTFQSIPETFWWAIITMTTVGYGDVTPKSSAGKVVGALCACSGVLILALPVSVIGSNFTLYYSYAQARLRLPKRKQPALVMADKALVNAKIEQREAEQSAGGSEFSEDEKKTPRSRRQAISVASSGFSMNSTPKFGKKSGMISSGLGGLAHVMVEMTVPGQRRMALTPSSPITSQLETKKLISKSISTISSDTGASENATHEKPQIENKKRNKLASFFDSRKMASKSLIDHQDNRICAKSRECYRLASSPNLNTLQDTCVNEGMRNTLAPHRAIAPQLVGQGDGLKQHMACNIHRSPLDRESIDSLEKCKKKNNNNRTKKKQRERNNDNLSLSERNIPLRVRNGSVSSPLFKRLTRLGKSKSNKNLIRTESTESEHLLHVLDGNPPADRNNLPHDESSVNIFITDVDSDADCGEPSNRKDKNLSNGRHSLGYRTRRSVSLMENPFTDSSH